MSHFVAGILRIIMLEASAALLVVGRVVPASAARAQRRLDLAWRVLAVLALFSWTNYGALRYGGGLVHRWEQYHFFFGSKYLREVGYFDLYKATILADRETTRVLTYVTKTRDLTNFEEVPVAEALRDQSEVRARFSPERWEAFKRDWVTLAAGGADWSRILIDHGNSGSPAWAAVAAPLAHLFGIGPGGQQAMGLVDIALMVALFAFVATTFGTRPACLMAIIWAMIPVCFDYLAGSFLRWDWLFALGLCLCFWQRRRPALAGACLGYAIMSKLFPLWFGVAWACSAAWTFVRTRNVDPRWPRFCAGGAAAVALSLAISSALFGPSSWRGYAERIEVARVEKYYGNQYSFRTVFLQLATSRPGEFARDWMTPPVVKQSLREVDIKDFKKRFMFWQLVLSAVLAFALGCADELEAFSAGPFFIWIWLVVNAYYWNMLALPALLWCLRGRLAPLFGLHALLIWFYVYQHLGHGFAEGYFVGLLLLGLLLLWAGATLWRGRQQQLASTQTPL